MEFVPSVDTKLLYERLKTAQPEETIPYEELSKIVGRNVENGARGLLNSARRMAQKEDRIVFGPVRGVGIKRMTDSEIANMLEAIRTAHRRRATRDGKKLECVEFDKLAGNDKVKHQVARTLVGFVHQATSPSQVKQLESAVEKSNTALTFTKTLEAFKK